MVNEPAANYASILSFGYIDESSASVPVENDHITGGIGMEFPMFSLKSYTKTESLIIIKMKPT
jgi:hypothetical protein